jgi:3'-phosphoadenosine 5'-phosphosulfate sulfotransferase
LSQARKINKAIYLLIEKYHRLYGLEVYGFSGGHGPGYAGF